MVDAEDPNAEVQVRKDKPVHFMPTAAFSQNPEFFSFYRSMEAYRSTFRGRNDLMLLETNSDFLRYFRDSLGRQAQPPRK